MQIASSPNERKSKRMWKMYFLKFFFIYSDIDIDLGPEGGNTIRELIEIFTLSFKVPRDGIYFIDHDF